MNRLYLRNMWWEFADAKLLLAWIRERSVDGHMAVFKLQGEDRFGPYIIFEREDDLLAAKLKFNLWKE